MAGRTHARKANPKYTKFIYIGENEFTSIKPIQKLNTPFLAELHISISRFIQDGNPFKKAPLDRIRLSEVVDCISLEE